MALTNPLLGAGAVEDNGSHSRRPLLTRGRVLTSIALGVALTVFGFSSLRRDGLYLTTVEPASLTYHNGKISYPELGGTNWPQAPIDVEDFPFVYVLLGRGGQTIARAIVRNTDDCPAIHMNGMEVQPAVTIRVTGRAAAVTPEDPYDFPVRVCEAVLPRDNTGGTWGGRRVPPATTHPANYTVIGDTGLRVKPTNDGTCRKFSGKKLFGVKYCEEKGDFRLNDVNGHFQSIGNWGMYGVMKAATKTHPDVVIHVGDILYRQAPCAPEKTGCESINTHGQWGDTWRGWAADYFIPARELLELAPFVYARGDHESCHRAGHGWFMFLDPDPYPTAFEGGQYCTLYTDAFVVPFRTEQLIVLDDNQIEPMNGQTGDWGGDHMNCKGGHIAYPRVRFDSDHPAQDPAYVNDELDRFTRQFQMIKEYSQNSEVNLYVSHRPLYAIACNGSHYVTLDWTVQEAARRVPGSLNRLSLAIGGHMHFFQELEWAGRGRPTQLVIGNSGTQLINDTLRNESLRHTLLVDGKIITKGVTTSRFGFVRMRTRHYPKETEAKHTATPILVNQDDSTEMPFGTIELPWYPEK